MENLATAASRSFDRYLLKPELPCLIDGRRAGAVRDLSIRGARIEHDEALNSGDVVEVRVDFAPGRSVRLQGRVIWTMNGTLQSSPGGRTRTSGIEIDGSEEVLLTELESLSTRGRAVAIDEHRVDARYLLQPQLAALFAPVGDIRILDLSEHGAKIQSDSLIRIGSRGSLRVTIAGRSPLVVDAAAVWSHARREASRISFTAGLHIREASDIALEIRYLSTLRRAARDTATLEDKFKTARMRQRDKQQASQMHVLKSAIPADEVLLVRHARAHLVRMPEAALSALNRAKFSAVDAEVAKILPHDAPHRHDILVLWEYLERKIDLRRIETIFTRL